MPRSYSCVVCGKTSPQARCPKHRLGSRPRGNGFEGTVRAVIAEHRMVCHICGKPIVSREDLHVDHVVPRASAATAAEAAKLDRVENLKPSHRWCNLTKGDRHHG